MTQPTRRTIVTAMLAAPAVALPGLPAIGAPINAELKSKLAAHRRAVAAHAAHEKQAYRPVQDRCMKAREAWQRDCEAIPHRSIPHTAENGAPMEWVTGNRIHLAVATTIASGKFGHSQRAVEEAKTLVDAEAKREEERQHLFRKHRLPELEAEFDRVYDADEALTEQMTDAIEQVIACRANTMADLVAKIEFVEAQLLEPDQFLSAILADARNLQDGRA